ncbi:membrane protein [Microlunatus panaciterrae]|uniref:Membrane protein n=1 Tax=Microlunatus panaciterrae TaxID=400768 RepID=A0ABS2RDP3_9ACTN|nr:membrane protein [Microlunatus panaciterrae]
MIDWLKALKDKPAIAHLLRAGQRFAGRMGDQFGAAITYFSVLAMVPIIMFAFSVTGFILVELRPELLDALEKQLSNALGGSGQGANAKIMSVIDNALRNYAAIGIIGLLSAMYSGAGWAGNLKNAVRAQWRQDFDLQVKKENVIVSTLKNLGILLGLLLAVAITFGLASVSTSLTDNILGWLGMTGVPWLALVLRLVPIAVSLGAGWLLFMYLYLVLPETRAPWPAVRRGSLLGAVGLIALQYLASFLIGRFTTDPAAGLFGPVIVLMLFFNLFARLILFVAAWISTAEPAGGRAGGPVAEATTAAQGAAAARARSAVEAKAATPVLVPRQVAVRSVRVGMGAGYVAGAATGVGLGAMIAAFFARVAARRRERNRD